MSGSIPVSLPFDQFIARMRTPRLSRALGKLAALAALVGIASAQTLGIYRLDVGYGASTLPISLACDAPLLDSSDASGNALPLAGQVAGSARRAFLRNGAAITLNDTGDTITLFAPGDQQQDSYTYSGSHEGLRITTGH